MIQKKQNFRIKKKRNKINKYVTNNLCLKYLNIETCKKYGSS